MTQQSNVTIGIHGGRRRLAAFFAGEKHEEHGARDGYLGPSPANKLFSKPLAIAVEPRLSMDFLMRWHCHRPAECAGLGNPCYWLKPCGVSGCWTVSISRASPYSCSGQCLEFVIRDNIPPSNSKQLEAILRTKPAGTRLKSNKQLVKEIIRIVNTAQEDLT